MSELNVECCKKCRIKLNGASIIPCGGNLICSKCLHSKTSDEDLPVKTRTTTTTMTANNSTYSTVDRKELKMSSSKINPNSNLNQTNANNSGTTTPAANNNRVESKATINESTPDLAIEANTGRVIDAINRAADDKIREIENVRVKLIHQVKMDRCDLLTNSNSQQQQKNNQSVNSIYDTVSHHFNQQDTVVSSKSANGTLMRQASVGIRFSPAKEMFKVSELGAIEYDDALYRIDARTKISLLNNDFQYKVLDLSRLIQPVTINKQIQLLAPDKILLIHEKALGRVLITHLKILFPDGSILYETERQNVDAFYHTHAIYSNKHIILAYEIPNHGFQLTSFDFRLNVERERDTDVKLDSMLTSETRFYLIRDTHRPTSHLIHEFDYDFNRLRIGFGQNKSPKKPFYVDPGADVFAVENERIYIKTESKLKILDKRNGQLLNQLVLDDLHLSKVFLDVTSDEEMFLVFNGYQRVSLYDNHGEVVASNKIRVHERFDRFQFIRAGYFGFVNTEKMIILII